MKNCESFITSNAQASIILRAHPDKQSGIAPLNHQLQDNINQAHG